MRFSVCFEIIATTFSNNNPGEAFERVTLEIAQYIATEVPGAGYMRRALIVLQEPKLLPPSKPRSPEELPEDVTDDDEMASYEEEMPNTKQTWRFGRKK
jgi:hypothetical protein